MRKSILSINANKSMNFLVQTVLSPGYDVTPVTDVYLAMGEMKRRDDIELVIIDVDYHTQENLDFIQHIKTSGLYQDTSFIVLASNDKFPLGRMRDSGVIELFHKPFSPQEMVSRIDEMMKSQALNLSRN